MRENTQEFVIATHLMGGKTLTSREAFDLYGTTRLSAVIYNLRHIEGLPITDERIKVKNRFGRQTLVSRYKWEREANA